MSLSDVARVIAIDGPSGPGKSTIAKDLANSLSFVFIDTGAMFRALALWAHRQHKQDLSGLALQQWIESLHFVYGESKTTLVAIDGVNLTEDIREHKVSQMASDFSQIKEVRQYLLQFQRRLARNAWCVMEGRDIGTVVFPNAFCKIFLTAELDERARRRLDQLRAKGEIGHSFESVKQDLIMRDENDQNRPVAPLRQAEDALLLDSTHLNPTQVKEKMIEFARNKAQEAGLEWPTQVNGKVRGNL